MLFALTFLLVLAATISLLAGLSGSGVAGYAGAAVCSLLALLVTARRISSERHQVFVSDPPASPVSQGLAESPAAPDDDEVLPTDIELGIDGYDDLVAAEVLPALETLSVEQLRAVIARERAGLARLAIMERASRLIGLTTGEIKLDLDGDDQNLTRSRALGQDRSSPDLTL